MTQSALTRPARTCGLLRMGFVAALLAAASPASAQSANVAPSVSPSYALLAAQPNSAGGELSSANFQLSANVGGPAISLHASSASASFEGSLLVSPQSLGAGPPRVIATSPDLGPAAGGASVTVMGLRLDDGAAPTIEFGGGLASVTSSGQLYADVVTPAGTNAFGNPLAAVDVRATHSGGTHVASDVYAYGPMLRLVDSPTVGGIISFELLGAGIQLSSLSLSKSTAGFGLPFAPFDGSIELTLPFFNLVSLGTHVPGVRTFNVPKNPALAGITLHFQSLVVDSLAPLGGSFSNVVPATIAP